jgi:predicted O-linked N-acetylglucosamine transferase (SPINDLY family)
MADMTIEQAMELAASHLEAGRVSQAAELYSAIVAQQADYAPAMNNLACIAHRQGRNADAVELLRRAAAASPNDPAMHSNLGTMLLELGQVDEAIAACRRAIALAPGMAAAHNNLCMALRQAGQLDQAIAAGRRAIALEPALAEAYDNLGNALGDAGQAAEAVTLCRQAVMRRPEHPGGHNNLGAALEAAGPLDQAVAAYQQAVALNPRFAGAWSNLGGALRNRGQLDDAITAFSRAIAIDPQFAAAQSNLLYSLHFHPDCDAMAIAAAHRPWNESIMPPASRGIRPQVNRPLRRLRIGYVSPDFRSHVVGRNVLPLLREHDRREFEIFCYSNVIRPDALTTRFKALSTGWRHIAGVPDHEVAQQVRDDRIDILVDLALHLGGNRLGVFAHRPAPVQITFAGYPGSTGLDAIDYRLTDSHLDPPGQNDHLYTERSIRLADSFWCYDPESAAESHAAGQPLNRPSRSASDVVFGSLNHFAKVNRPVLELWARVMVAVPNSRLTLAAPEGIARQHVLQVLGQPGIDAGRVDFVTPGQSLGQYLDRYLGIDIGLDTFPYNGHTTTLDALWMGVPVVTLVGRTVVGRAGLSQLTNLGLAELIATSPDRYVEIAVDLAHDSARLGALRENLRSTMRSSPLTDAARFARSIEAAYRQMWQGEP